MPATPTVEKPRNGPQLKQANSQGVSAAIAFLKAGVRTAAMIVKLVGPAVGMANCVQNGTDVSSESPSISQSSQGLTIQDFQPPRAPFVLPFQNGVATRVSQIAGGATSHHFNSTRYAVDFVDETFFPSSGEESGLVLAPLAGTVHQVQDAVWGKVVELTGRDGMVYIAAHCNNFRDEAAEGAFVLRGTPLCRIGNTGSSSSGTHLHFDKITNPGNPSSYQSQGVERYITMRVGEPEPSLVTPDEFNTCCNTCSIRPQNADCAEYISFNRPLTETLTRFTSRIQQADSRIAQVIGTIIPDRDTSFRRSPIIGAYQNITLRINGQTFLSKIYFYVLSPSGGGLRNPFVDTAYAYVLNPVAAQWEHKGWYTKIHTERFINFDLWDVVNSTLEEQWRSQLPGRVLGFTETVQRNVPFPGNDRDWELHSTTFNVLGEEIKAELAVWKQNRGIRWGRYYRGGIKSQWILM